MSTLLSRMVEMWRTGTMFGGQRDLYKTFGWNREACYRDFVLMYERQDIAGRVNDSLPRALWSDPPEVTGSAAFTVAWQDLNVAIPVFPVITRLDKLAGLGRYAVLLIGFDDGQPLDQPVRKAKNVLYLQPYGEGSVEVNTYETDPSNPRFGQPILYDIKQSNVDPTFATSLLQRAFGPTLKVHHSRVLHVAVGALETTLYGLGRIKPVYNVLQDIQKVTGASAETFWLTGNRGLHIDIDKDLELEPEDEESLSDELKEYEHEQRRTIRTRGVKITPLGSTIADPSNTFEVQLSLLASRTGIPQRVLMGSEAGQLASQQDRAEWAQRVQEEISEYGGPIVLYPFIRKLINAGVLPDSTIDVKWPDAFKMNPLERAQTSAQMARSAANLAKALQTIETTNQSAAQARQATQQQNVDPATGKTTSVEIPAIITAPFKEIELLTPEECRSIIGFGQHPPVFDSTDTTPAAVGKSG